MHSCIEPACLIIDVWLRWNEFYVNTLLT